MEHWALFVHLVGVLPLRRRAAPSRPSASRRPAGGAEPGEIALLLGVSRWGVALVSVGGALCSSAGSGWPGWCTPTATRGCDAAIALFIVLSVLGGIGGQRPKQARLLATKLAAEGGDTAELRRLLDDRATLAINYVSALLVVAVLVLMIWRPGE